MPSKIKECLYADMSVLNHDFMLLQPFRSFPKHIYFRFSNMEWVLCLKMNYYNPYFNDKFSIYLLIARFSFVKLTFVRIELEETLKFLTLFDIALPNGHVFIMPGMVILIVFIKVPSKTP
jgi:hypothetical protein